MTEKVVCKNTNFMAVKITALSKKSLKNMIIFGYRFLFVREFYSCKTIKV